jgi:hypothetical protein
MEIIGQLQGYVERAHATQCIAGRVGPSTGFEVEEKREIFKLLGIQPLQSSPHPVAIPTGLP